MVADLFAVTEELHTYETMYDPLYMHCVRAKDAVMVRIGTGSWRKCVNISRDGADQIYVNHRHRAFGWLGSGGGGCLKRLQPPTFFLLATVTVTSLL